MAAIVSLSVAGAVVARSASESGAQAAMFAILGLLTFASVSLVIGVPEPAGG